jgi:carboxyl-terminal processing protease
MLPASHKGPGLNFGSPDVCLTPVGPVIVPIPYPNFAAHAMAVAFVPNVLVAMIPALNLGSVIPMTTGDEPGVAHWTFMGPGTFVAGNPVVFVGGLPGINVTCPALGNNGNCANAMVVAPGAPNVLYTLAREEAESIDAQLERPPLVDERMAAEGVGYLRVTVFSWRLPAAFEAAVARLSARGMRALVIDLRGCPGGELTAFLELAGDFLECGAELVTMIDAEGDEVRHCARRAPAHDFPLALLVDGDTASAAELFAACLSAHGRAVVAGAPTRGKDTGQIVVRASSGEAVSLTAARFTPPGAALDAEGRVVPHLRADDPLAAAIHHLNGSP